MPAILLALGVALLIVFAFGWAILQFTRDIQR